MSCSQSVTQWLQGLTASSILSEVELLTLLQDTPSSARLPLEMA